MAIVVNTYRHAYISGENGEASCYVTTEFNDQNNRLDVVTVEIDNTNRTIDTNWKLLFQNQEYTGFVPAGQNQVWPSINQRIDNRTYNFQMW